MLARDGFWDGANDDNASSLDPSAYHDPAEEILPLSHVSMAAALPPPIQGARGTVVRKSTMGGVPLGWDPHGVATRINIDPDIQGQGFVVDPTRISAAMAAAAVEVAGVKKAQTVADLRFRAANAMREFSINSAPEQPSITTGSQRSAPVPLPGVYVVPESTLGGAQVRPDVQPPGLSTQGVQTKTAEMAKHNITGFSRPDNLPQRPAGINFEEEQRRMKEEQQFIAAQQAGQQEDLPLSPLAKPRPVSMFATMTKKALPTQSNGTAAGAPTYKVTFEIDGKDGWTDTWYHDITRNEQALIFVWDTRAVGYTRSHLHTQPRDVAIHVDGADVFYVCVDPGIKFVYDNNEYTVFLIKNEHPFNTTPAVPQFGPLV